LPSKPTCWAPHINVDMAAVAMVPAVIPRAIMCVVSLMANYPSVSRGRWAMVRLLSISRYGVDVPVIPPLPEPLPLLPLLRFFPRRLVPSELVPELPEPAVDPPVDPGEPVPAPAAPDEPVPGEPVPDEPADVPDPVPDPEPLPAPCAKTKEPGVSADNNIANTIFFMMCMSFLSNDRRQTRPYAPTGGPVSSSTKLWPFRRRASSGETWSRLRTKVQGTSDISATAAVRMGGRERRRTWGGCHRL